MLVMLEIRQYGDKESYEFEFTDLMPPGVEQRKYVLSTEEAKAHWERLHKLLESAGLGVIEQRNLPGRGQTVTHTYEDVEAKAEEERRLKEEEERRLKEAEQQRRKEVEELRRKEAEEQRRKEVEELHALRREVEEQRKLLAAKDMEQRRKEAEDKEEQEREEKNNQSEGTYVLSGNPLLGKSTTGNCILEEQIFESGPGEGKPVTEKHKKGVSSTNGKIVFDTPGLAAGKKGRKIAAREIEKPLRQGGVFRLLFFVKDEFGYVTEESKTNIKLILDAFRDIRDNQFSIIVNMCHGDWADQMNKPQNEEQQNYKEKWEECLLEGLPRTTKFILYEKVRPEWLYQKNKYAKLGEDTETFLANAPKAVLLKNEGKILDETYEDMVDNLAEANRRFADLRETLAAGKSSLDDALQVVQQADGPHRAL